MPSATTVFVIFSVIVFISGSAFGALVLFSVSIHRARRTSLYDACAQRPGAIARSLLISARTDRREDCQ